ncbi:alkane hydroxylase MAH1-like [Prosopis cineraria]|uniref:alkane hydroxylase MAH1-like n=1 Tax=Prosopis cineraria TaxID=364024 RepID=UPI00240EC296|nr:alkane hydroxylase MAH1-like [Prosopis cineraria]
MLGCVQVIAGFAAFLFLLFHIHRRRCCRDPLLPDWPLFGMLPPILKNLGQINDYATRVLRRNGGTGNFLGPWFTGMNYLATSDPTNVHHMMSKNFANYIKGPVFREIFEAFGDGIFTADSDSWKHHRALLHSLFKTKSFEKLLEKIVQKKMDKSLVPLLDHVERRGIEVDLQDVFNRLNFDIICSTILGSDPESLAIDFPEVACERAFNEAEEFIFYRHTVPISIWKLQRWLRIGPEKKMAEACEVFDRFLHESIASKREKLNKDNEKDRENDDLLTCLMREKEGKEHVDDKFLRDTAFNLFVAGRDTITSALTWFFWLVAKHPSVEAKILEEIKEEKETKSQVYLHGALCEALRLYPPIPFERKQAVEHDILPSGHEVGPGTMILLSLYAVGRCEEVWGKDCMEFKPERWISKKGSIVHIPSYTFISFNAGPRTCLGKDLSFIQMKIVASSILKDYQVHIVKDHPISPSLSIVLLMRYGLKVWITKRN